MFSSDGNINVFKHLMKGKLVRLVGSLLNIWHVKSSFSFASLLYCSGAAACSTSRPKSSFMMTHADFPFCSGEIRSDAVRHRPLVSGTEMSNAQNLHKQITRFLTGSFKAIREMQKSLSLRPSWISKPCLASLFYSLGAEPRLVQVRNFIRSWCILCAG